MSHKILQDVFSETIKGSEDILFAVFYGLVGPFK